MKTTCHAKSSWLGSLKWVFFSTVFITGGTLLTLFILQRIESGRRSDERFLIRSIVQTGPAVEALPTAYLAEILSLSVDQPTNLYSLDLEAARTRLLQNPVIKEARLSRRRPGTLYIDYTVRLPAAVLATETNTALDEEGHLFPLRPFFTPKHLPRIRQDASGGGVSLAVALLKRLESTNGAYRPLLVDLSHLLDDNLGTREVVVIVERFQPTPQRLFVRLPDRDPLVALTKLQRLAPLLRDERGDLTIDLRLDRLAYIGKEELRQCADLLEP